MDDIDKKLLDIVQDEFPLTSEPYREIAVLLGVSEDDVILRLEKLKEEGIIRRIGAIFDSKKLGYCSTLCAMRVPARRVDEVAEIVNEYPGVTHNYIRDYEYNIWFTITGESRRELDRIMAEIREKSGIEDLMDLPAVRMFKIRVRFSMLDTGGDKPLPYESQASNIQNPEPSIQRRVSRAWTPGFSREWTPDFSQEMVTEFEKGIVRQLQGDILLSRKPFESIAGKLGIKEAELLTKLRELKDGGVIRRFGAILRHRNIGISANAMAVWSVPEDKAEEVGMKMAAFPQVSHCYQRPTRPGWPYNLFTMLHGRAVGDCERVARLISSNTGIRDYRLLYSTRELKKVSMRYFDP